MQSGDEVVCIQAAGVEIPQEILDGNLGNFNSEATTATNHIGYGTIEEHGSSASAALTYRLQTLQARASFFNKMQAWSMRDEDKKADFGRR